MPLIQTITTEYGRVGIWQIDGSEPELYSSLFQIDPRTEQIAHPRTSLQRKASRVLLAEMLGFVPELAKDIDGRPKLSNSPLKVSISHTDGYAAAVLGNGHVSVDVQAITPRILKLRERFLKDKEQLMAPTMELATLLWATKETAYKFRATDKHDFREPISILHISEDTIWASLRLHKSQYNLTLGYRWLPNAALVFLEKVETVIV
jgi:phosphopantetheinyl transferase (holo-ACP synthase)